MRVLQIVSQLDGGGAERVALSLIDGLVTAGVSVRGIGFYGPRWPVVERLKYVVRDYCDVLGKSRGLDPRIYGRLLKAIRTFRPDVLHCHLGVLKYVWPVAVRAGHIPVVHTVHSLAGFDATIATRVSNTLAFHLGNVTPVAVAEAVAASVRNVYRVKACPVIYNGVYGTKPAVGRAQWRAGNGIGSSSVVFIWVAALARPKAPFRVLEAFTKAFSGNPEAELVYLGDGPFRAALAEEIAQAGLERRVHLMGFRADVPDALSAADVFVHGSDIEGDPLSLKEGMLMGLPVIAASVGGVPEAVEHGLTGYLYSPDDVAALANLMRQIAMDVHRRERLAEAARTKAQQKFTVRQMTDEYLSLYKRLAA